MKELYYKGQAYAYKMVEHAGNKTFHLYQHGELKHVVEEHELDVKSIVSLILDSYYKNNKPAIKSAVLS